MSGATREKSELSQYSFMAEKCHILKGTVRQGTDEPICRAATGDAARESRLVDTVGEGEGGMQ